MPVTPRHMKKPPSSEDLHEISKGFFKKLKQLKEKNRVSCVNNLTYILYRAIQRVCNFIVKTAYYEVANSLNNNILESK